MKLLTKYNRINVLATIIVLLLSSGCYYVMIHAVLINELDNDLHIEEQEINDFIHAKGRLPNATNIRGQQITFELTKNSGVKRRFISRDLFISKEEEYEETRQLLFPVKVDGNTYVVKIQKSQEETEYLIKIILLISFGVLILLLLILFLLNRFLLNKLWRPFNSTLQQLKQFTLFNKNNLELEGSSIDEFAELNQSVKIMTSQVRRDYETLKNFTENASHEMQTPLAIINSKLDVLIQDEKITEYQMFQLQGIYKALDRLSKLNQSLLLLTKIENNQFKQTENIPLHKLIKEKMVQFEEMIEGKKIAFTLELQPAGIQCNKQLADILISNLFNNAIRYNQPNGSVNLQLTNHKLIISNTSSLPGLDDQKLFQRFYRHSDSKQEGNGLGLSIIKQICDAFGFTISYTFKNENHSFQILF